MLLSKLSYLYMLLEELQVLSLIQVMESLTLYLFMKGMLYLMLL